MHLGWINCASSYATYNAKSYSRSMDKPTMPSQWQTHHVRYPGIQFTQNQLIQINSVCLYLQVNLLSEIADHTGNQILPDKLKPVTVLQDTTFSSPNWSTLDWPKQTKPGPTTWKKWKEIILWMYMQPTTTTLTHPLGQWLPTYTQDYEWAWQLHKLTRKLSHHHCHVWYKYSNCHQWLNVLIYQKDNQPCACIPPDTLPVTPKLTKQMMTVASPIMQHQERALPIITPVCMLYQRLTEPPNTLDQPLWDHICRHKRIATLHGAIQEGRPIIIVSNATVNHQGYGACSWAIWSQQLLWSGEGQVPIAQIHQRLRLCKSQ